MKKTKVGRYVLSLNEGEIKEFRDFLASPYFNKSKLVQRYFELVLKGVNGKKGDSEYIFKKLYPEEKFNQKRLSFLSSRTINLIESFYEHKGLKIDKNYVDISKYAYMIHTGKFDLAKKIVENRPVFSSPTCIDRSDYRNDYLLVRYSMLYKFLRGQLASGDDYESALRLIYKYFISTFCEIMVSLIGSRKVNNEFKDMMTARLKTLVADKQLTTWLDDGLVDLYISSAMFVANEIEPQEYYSILAANGKNLTVAQLGFFISMRGVRLLKAHRGNPTHKNLMAVYRHYEEYFQLVRNSQRIEHIPTAIFLDVIEVLSTLSNSNALMDLWKTNKSSINGSDSVWVAQKFELYYALNQEDFQKSLVLLNDPEIRLDTVKKKQYQIQCYVSLNEWRAAKNTINSLRTYLSEKQLSNEITTYSRYFIKVCSLIIRINEQLEFGSRQRASKLYEQLKEIRQEKKVKVLHWLNNITIALANRLKQDQSK